MAKPLSFEAFLDAMRDEGVTVKVVGDAKHHNRAGHGSWGPVHGVMVHHTVTEGTQNSINICRNGYMTLPGPLCHGVIDKAGVVHVVGYGRANHAGLGDDDVLRAVIAESSLPKVNEANTDGNSRFYGFECVNLGNNSDPWPEAQVEAIVRATAGILRRHGWGKDGSTSVIGHKEWQPGKIDPRGPIGKKGGTALTMDAIRKRVAERLKHPATWSPGGTGGGNTGGTYTVRKGDTLWSIAAAKLGAGARNTEIAKLNGLKDPAAITPGQKLKIPAK
ncbi:endolysin [Streptomyces phage SF1]|uniref:LysM domain-containing protein n=2 Tax=Caudoviricetes TaxID=2731619 RepID=A0A0K1Y5X7_9CAUD|nr:N-acetylmuramoyl-L-alanine amidase [Streptomyces sp. SPB78]YP_009199290.1 endolysin [Streptomyces phage SF1]YP_009213149.1 endolysin [Streptomyces phage SF3]AKY02191.1 hypothetical protein SF1_420 [Streptomyces phage SF1]ALF00153.1 hypothetical protein SF3_220 [Streptomyces phage SF3]EFL00572.1 peptidoglycan-binding domain 1 containing protein [Streptomyces sp. SPB78]